MPLRPLASQRLRQLSPELDPLRLGTGWSVEDLAKPQVFVSSTFGDSHPGSGHLDVLVQAAMEGHCAGRRAWCTLLWHRHVHDVHVLEGVAAGDAFCAGLLHALAQGYDQQDTIDYAIAASVLKLTIRGDANLVTEDEIWASAKSASGARVMR